MKKRVLDILRRLRDAFPLTWLGVAVVAGAVVASAHYGFGRIDMVLLAAGLVGVGLGAITLLTTVITSLVLWRKVRARRSGESDLSLECGYPSRTGFAVGRPWFVPFVRVGWTWIDPPAEVRQVAGRGFRLEEEVFPTGRGLQERIVRRFVVGDVFGLTRVAWESVEPRTIRVLPSVGGLKQMHVVRSLSGGEELPHPEGTPEGERIDLRHYVPGDPIKFILWKVFAKNREVVVRTPERALSAARQTVAYLVSGEGDEPAAGAARVAIDVGALGGDWVFGADGVDMSAKSKAEALECLARSSGAEREECGQRLGEFLKTASPGGSGRAVVFVPGRPGPWLDGVVRSAGKLASGPGGVAPMEFIVCTDGIAQETKRGWFARWAHRTDLDAPAAGSASDRPVLSKELSEVVQRLGTLRARVLVIDRRDGRVYGEEHQRRLAA